MLVFEGAIRGLTGRVSLRISRWHFLRVLKVAIACRCGVFEAGPLKGSKFDDSAPVDAYRRLFPVRGFRTLLSEASRQLISVGRLAFTIVRVVVGGV